MIFNIQILNLLSWILVGFIVGGVLPVIAAFFAPAAQLDTEVVSKSRTFTSDGLKSVFDKYWKLVTMTITGALVGGLLYRLISGSSFSNYSLDGYFYVIIGCIWMFLVYKFLSSEK